MYKITLHNEIWNKDYALDLSPRKIKYVPGTLICYVCPFIGIPLRLEIGICPDGSVAHRGWEWSSNGNHYLQTREKPEDECLEYEKPFVSTQRQRETVAGLFSGRIK